MKSLFILLFFTLSLFSLSLEESKHLLNRTSFGFTKDEIKLFQKLTKEEAVDLLLQKGNSKDIYKKPKNIKDVSIINKKIKEISKEKRKKLRKQKNKKMQEIKSWWYEMMINPRFSFREKMTLFWHNHFVSEYKVVKSPYMMFEQNMLFRENALDSFSTLLHKSSHDLAMLIYLDNNSNKKSHPNENFARELLELFTLGEGNYSEDDVKEAARAFTGYRVNKRKATFKILKKHHDYGVKTFLNEKGNFNGSSIIDIILKQKQTAIFITTKLYQEFISEDIKKDEVLKFAKKFRDSNYDITVLMRNILLSNSFWKNKSNMIKSPVELIVSFLKISDIKLKPKEYNLILKYGRDLGQDLFNPPNVNGWKSGKDWIDTTSLIIRKELINKLIKKKLNTKQQNELQVKNFKTLDYQIK